MSARLLGLWRSTTSKLRDNRGEALIMGIFMMLFIIAVFIVLLESWRVMNVAAEASRKITTTVTSIAANQIHNSYSPIRDATSGAFVFDADDWVEIQDTNSFYTTFDKLFEHTRLTTTGVAGGVNGNRYLYAISAISVNVNNAGKRDNTTTYRVEYTLIIPQDFFWSERYVVLSNQIEKIRYLNKF